MTEPCNLARRILVVEDEPVIRRLLEETLACDGVEVVVASNVSDALLCLDRQHFDVALVDLLLPLPTGWDLLDALRDHPGWPRAVVVSAVATPSNKARAYDMGAVDVMLKPFDPMDLADRVDRVACLGPDEVDAYRNAQRARAYA
ncbi:MAG: response regulator [Acidimicrobiales bacterium]